MKYRKVFRKVFSLITALMLLSTTACSSSLSRAFRSETYGTPLYCGTYVDAALMYQSVKGFPDSRVRAENERGVELAILILAAVDFPFSFLHDTALLPVDLVAASLGKSSEGCADDFRIGL